MIPLGPFPLGILCDSAQSPWQHQNSPLSLLSLEVQPIPRLSPATFPLQGRAGQGRTAGREGIPQSGSSGSALELLASPNYTVIS